MIPSPHPSPGHQAVCLGNPIRTPDHGNQERRAEGAEGLVLPQCRHRLHMDLCTVPGTSLCVCIYFGWDREGGPREGEGEKGGWKRGRKRGKGGMRGEGGRKRGEGGRKRGEEGEGRGEKGGGRGEIGGGRGEEGEEEGKGGRKRGEGGGGDIFTLPLKPFVILCIHVHENLYPIPSPSHPNLPSFNAIPS